ncbi:heterokaryon incompatibility protein-domain-containing protein [Lasiosphaeris hirsuta]|uniref:Heterokaryon incompatibility protein-domain-containing protein n=1 Tax=Lasiosphaeris hirsuta TaxID=260670 RepID=A0AA40AQS6_9PEZI|nr:heterokaryon incompatibility protein-domain-containing protein [Lasiosphaeris hirsuta]
MTSFTTTPAYSASLAPVGKNTELRIEYYAESSGSSILRSHRVCLDHQIGNHEGRFHIGGAHFSQSARDIRLVGHTLRAKLATSNESWWDDEIAIDVEIPAELEAHKPIVSFRRCDFLRFKGCRNLRLIGDFLLAAEYLTTDLTYKGTYLDLDECLGRNKGNFDRNGTGFTYRAKDVELIGSTLYADLSGGTQRRASIDLKEIVQFQEGGSMVPLRDVKPEHLDYGILRDNPSSQGWLANTHNVRLLNYRRKRKWYLIADCLAPYGGIRESVIKLHETVGPWDGQMFSVLPHSTPDLPENARHASLENGILTASFMTEGESRNIWVERPIDLREIVANEGGELTRRRAGTDCPTCAGLFCAGAVYTPWTGCAWQLGVPENLRWQPLRCPMCRLIQDSFKAFVPTAGPREVWIETEGEDYCPTYFGRPRNRRVELVIRPKASTLKKLQSIMQRSKQPSVPSDVRISVQIELEGPAYAKPQPYRPLPAQFRTLQLNTDGICWLEPSRRWIAIRKWIETCLTEHDGCRGDGVTPELPTRYLDIGVGDQDTVKVVKSAGAHGDYACLSHCWGGKNECTLTSKTMGRFAKVVPQRVLPPVFANAIAVCRRLGIRRLWIDSLCILQDSKDDWRQESQRMGRYYSKCQVCIAATSSASSAESFNIISDRPTVIRSPGLDPGSGPFNLTAYPTDLTNHRSHFGHTSELETLRRDFPLLTRAWVLQERWLSPRVLHFCGSEVVLECSEATVCECGRAGRDLMSAFDTTDTIGKFTWASTRSTTTSQEGLLSRRIAVTSVSWDHFVTTYSCLSLTFPTDRLIAISGIASTIYYDRYRINEKGEELIPSTMYLAGLWRDNLVKDLAWFIGPALLERTAKEKVFEIVGTGARRKPKPKQYLAPSWSWASILDPVRYLTHSDDVLPLFNLLDAYVKYATNDPFGSVEDGCSIYVRGRLLETLWETRPGTDNTGNVSILTDLVGTQQLDKEDGRGVIFSPDFEFEHAGPYQLLPRTKLFVFLLKRIPINYSRWIKVNDAQQDAVKTSLSSVCLVLKAVEGLNWENSHIVYERVGYTEYVSFKDGERNNDVNDYVEQDFYII